MKASTIRLLACLAAGFASALPLAGCGGGGSSGSSNDKPLIVTYFNVAGRTDVYRNQRIEIRFSTKVKKSSVDDRTVQVLTGPNLRTPVDGALIVQGNKIFFDPTRTQKQVDRVGPTGTEDKPFGLDALTQYQVVISAPPTLKTITNRAGTPIVQKFVGTFTTSDLYVPELVPPEFVGTNNDSQHPKLGFIPAPDSNGQVAYNAEIVLDFSEAIAPATMVPGKTVLIENQDVVDANGQPVSIPGTFQHSSDGRQYDFVPSFHYGTGPFHISVSLTQDIEDLAGNPLIKPVTLTFLTQYNPNVSTIGEVIESFDTSYFEDVQNTDAEWNTTVSGSLVGGWVTTNIVTVQYVPDGVNSQKTRVDYPLVTKNQNSITLAWPKGVHVQATYTQSDINVQGAVTELAWGPDSNALFAATHPNIQIRLGHTNDTAGVIGPVFDDNFKDGVPQPSYDGEYQIPQKANINPPGTDDGFWPFPSLTTPFEYNNQNGLLIDWKADGANDFQLLRVWFFGVPANPANPGIRNIVASEKNGTSDDFTGGGQSLVYDMQFTIRRRLTYAQSNFYDTAQPQPTYADPQITPPLQSNGTSITIEWQGADGMPSPSIPNRVVPDPSTYTPWAASIGVADGKRFVRFRMTLIANLNTDAVPQIDEVLIPYSFVPK